MTLKQNNFCEYDEILKDMCDIESKDEIGSSKDKKLDMILAEVLELRKTVKELTDVVSSQTEHLESVENMVRETKQITYNSYKELHKANNTTIITTVTEYALPLVTGWVFPSSIAHNLSKMTGLSYQLYKNM